MGSRAHSECDNLMRSIQNYHMDSQGWSDIAYNLAVCEHGYIFEGRGKGKGSGANGTSDANHNYPAVCALVGENDPQPAALDNGIADAVAMLRSWGVGSVIKGHRDFVSTACPGNAIYNKIQDGRYSSPTEQDWFDMATQKDLEAAIVNVFMNNSDVKREIARFAWTGYQFGEPPAVAAAWIQDAAVDDSACTEGNKE